jgi:hypothetical protein
VEEILCHWCEVLRVAAVQGKPTVTVDGKPDRGIPSGKAFLWGDADIFSSLQPNFIDPRQRGVHCILLSPTPSSKRPASSQEELESPSKRVNTMTTSTSNDTAIADGTYFFHQLAKYF